MMTTVLPSLPAGTWTELESLLKALEGVSPEFQIDIVDGEFVSLTSWPFTEEVIDFQVLAPYAERFQFEFDCMVNAPERYLDQLVAVGAERIIIHHGSTTQWSTIVAHALAHGYQLGLAFTNDAVVADLDSVIRDADYVQVMGIAAVGQQGQPFDERTPDTIQALRTRYPTLPIAVDGSVNASTIPALVAAGANRLAPGSAISRATDPVVAYEQLVTLAARASSV